MDISAVVVLDETTLQATVNPPPGQGGGGGDGSGTVTSVGLVVPTGFSVSGSPVTVSGNITLSFAAGYSLPSNTSQANWDTAYSERLRWDGGSTGLNAATGRTSLGLGSASQRDAGTAAGNVPVLDGAGLVPSALLPGFVDDVLEFANIAAFPVTGAAEKLYINLATNRQYRWSGSVYTEINPSPGSTDAIPEGSVNLYFTTARGQSAAFSWWSGYRSTIGDQLATAANAAAARTALGAGTSSLLVSSAAPQPLAATASAGSTGQAADAGHAHQRDVDVIVIPVGDESTALTAGPNKVRFRMPFPATLLAVRNSLNLAPTGSPLIVDLNEDGTSVLGTKLSTDAGETSSTTAASPATITDPSLADDAEISLDIDQIGSTFAGAGLKVYLFVRRA